ncbi:MAG: glycosyltransferase family 4 protein [Lutimonas sp.]
MKKKKLHILFLNSWYPSAVFPFNGDFIQRHANAVALEHKVTSLHFVTDESRHKKYISEETLDNVRTIIVYLPKTNSIFQKFLLFWNAYRSQLNKLPDFDLIQVNRIYPLGIFALITKLIKKKPLLLMEHFTGYAYPHLIPISPFERFALKLVGKYADGIITVSEHLAEGIRNFGVQNKFFTIPNVVDTEIFRPEPHKNKIFKLLHVSSLSNAHKNVMGILKVSHKLLSEKVAFHLTLVGGEEKDYFKKIMELGLQHHTTVVPQVDQRKVADYMQKSDLFVLFSHYENLPCVILESFACGLPVVSSNVGGIDEYFPSDFGTLVKANNEHELYKAILAQMNKPQVDQQKMYIYAKNHFSKSVIAKKFTEVYMNALTNG